MIKHFLFGILLQHIFVSKSCSKNLRHLKLTIRGIEQILMIYVHVSSETWLPKVRSVMLHSGPLGIWALYKALYGIKRIKLHDEIKCYFFWIKLRKYTHLAWFLLSLWLISLFLGGFQVFVEIGQMDNRNQARWVYFLNFIQKSNILFHLVILSFVILNSIQCLVERSNSQRPTM